MRRSQAPSRELQHTCRHHDAGLPCGLDGQACTGRKVEVRITNFRGRSKKVAIAEYKHRELVEGPWIMCPKLKEVLYGSTNVPDMQSTTEVD